MSKRSTNVATSPRGPQPSWRTAIGTRAFTVMVGLGIVVFGVALTKELIRKIQIHQQIAALETEIASLEDHNTELNQLIEYFNTSSFQDKEARTKLGLVAPGETMVVVLDDAATTTANALATDTRSGTVADTRSNLQKWQDYFFNY